MGSQKWRYLTVPGIVALTCVHRCDASMNSGELLNYKKTMELQPSTGVLACTFNSMVSTSHAHHMHITCTSWEHSPSSTRSIFYQIYGVNPQSCHRNTKWMAIKLYQLIVQFMCKDFDVHRKIMFCNIAVIFHFVKWILLCCI